MLFLQQLANFCYEHHLLVISDEIHADMALFGHKHIPFASVSDKARNISITFQAPSKTFNIAGIVSSYAIIPNEDIRNKFYKWLSANELDEPTLFATIATIAAFRKGEKWRKAMNALFPLHQIMNQFDFVIINTSSQSFLYFAKMLQFRMSLHDITDFLFMGT